MGTREPIYRRVLTGPELALGVGVLGITLLWPIIAYFKGVDFNERLLALGLFIEISLFLLALYARFRLRVEPMAKFGIAFSYFFFFLTGFSNLILMRFPVSNLQFDAALQAIDDSIGYSWVGFLLWFEKYPTFGSFLGYLYATSLFQLALVFLFLSLTKRDRTLYRMMFTGAISLFITISIWLTVPSFGPAISFDLPDSVVQSVHLVVTPEFQDILLALIENGALTIPPETSVGLVEFPSFHTIMALLVVIYTFRTIVFWPAALLNAFMIPSILGQGAHYVADLLGGAVVFAIAAVISRRLVTGPATWPAPGQKS